MKKILLVTVSFAFLSGCASYAYNDPKVYQGASLGAAVGAASGALIDKHNRWRGAVIGGGLGAVLGGGTTAIQNQPR